MTCHFPPLPLHFPLLHFNNDDPNTIYKSTHPPFRPMKYLRCLPKCAPILIQCCILSGLKQSVSFLWCYPNCCLPINRQTLKADVNNSHCVSKKRHRFLLWPAKKKGTPIFLISKFISLQRINRGVYPVLFLFHTETPSKPFFELCHFTLFIFETVLPSTYHLYWLTANLIPFYSSLAISYSHSYISFLALLYLTQSDNEFHQRCNCLLQRLHA